MSKYTKVTNDIIRVDDMFFDVDQIAYISNINKPDSPTDEWSFSIMLVGHSNMIHFTSKEELTIKLKRKFIVEQWSSMYMVAIESFDEEQEMEDVVTGKFNPDDADFMFNDEEELNDPDLEEEQ